MFPLHGQSVGSGGVDESPGDVDWGNDSGSVLYLLCVQQGLDIVDPADFMIVQQAGFARSGKGSCTRRTNFWKALLGVLSEDASMVWLRDLILDAWRWTAFAMTLVWSSDLRSNHEYLYGPRGDLLSNIDADRFPDGDVFDFEIHYFVKDLNVPLPDGNAHGDGLRLFDVVPYLPESTGDFSKRSIAVVCGLKPTSRTVQRLHEVLCNLCREGRPHLGDPLRLCFSCVRGSSDASYSEL